MTTLAFEFARADKGSDDLFWSEYKKFMRNKANNNAMISLNSISNAAYCQATK